MEGLLGILFENGPIRPEKLVRGIVHVDIYTSTGAFVERDSHRNPK